MVYIYESTYDKLSNTARELLFRSSPFPQFDEKKKEFFVNLDDSTFKMFLKTIPGFKNKIKTSNGISMEFED